MLTYYFLRVRKLQLPSQRISFLQTNYILVCLSNIEPWLEIEELVGGFVVGLIEGILLRGR